MLVKRAGKSSTHSAVRGRVEDSGEGLYRASYVANFAGTYEVQVTAAGALSSVPLACLVWQTKAAAAPASMLTCSMLLLPTLAELEACREGLGDRCRC